MAKLTNPLYSINASGDFGKTLNFKNDRKTGTQVLRAKRRVPVRKKTPSTSQAEARHKFKVANEAWAMMSTEYKEINNTRGKEYRISGQNYFISRFVSRVTLPIRPFFLFKGRVIHVRAADTFWTTTWSETPHATARTLWDYGRTNTYRVAQAYDPVTNTCQFAIDASTDGFTDWHMPSAGEFEAFVNADNEGKIHEGDYKGDYQSPAQSNYWTSTTTPYTDIDRVKAWNTSEGDFNDRLKEMTYVRRIFAELML